MRRGEADAEPDPEAVSAIPTAALTTAAEGREAVPQRAEDTDHRASGGFLNLCGPGGSVKTAPNSRLGWRHLATCDTFSRWGAGGGAHTHILYPFYRPTHKR